MYVNEFTVDYGERGRRGVAELLGRAHRAGLLPRPVDVTFVSAPVSAPASGAYPNRPPAPIFGRRPSEAARGPGRQGVHAAPAARDQGPPAHHPPEFPTHHH